LGSTGSIGCNALQVIEHLGPPYAVAGLSGHTQGAKLLEQVRRHQPAAVAVTDDATAEEIAADVAAAGALSVLDYLGEIEWREFEAARDWYSRMKSRPSFRSLLNDRVRGLSPASHYADLDF